MVNAKEAIRQLPPAFIRWLAVPGTGTVAAWRWTAIGVLTDALEAI
jgi:hypothetical protein